MYWLDIANKQTVGLFWTKSWIMFVVGICINYACTRMYAINIGLFSATFLTVTNIYYRPKCHLQKCLSQHHMWKKTQPCCDLKPPMHHFGDHNDVKGNLLVLLYHMWLYFAFCLIPTGIFKHHHQTSLYVINIQSISEYNLWKFISTWISVQFAP